MGKRLVIKITFIILLICGFAYLVYEAATRWDNYAKQREGFLLDSFNANIKDSVVELGENETWYITIAVDRSKDVVDEVRANAYKQQIKNFIDRLSSKDLMSDNINIWVNVSVFDGVIEGNGTAHDISGGFFDITENESACVTLKKAIDQINFDATSTYVDGAIWGCQSILECVTDEAVQPIILLLTDGYNENYVEAEKNLIEKEVKQKYEDRSDTDVRSAEIVSIALNFPTDDSKTEIGRSAGQEKLRVSSKSKRYGTGVFLGEEGRENFCVIKDLAELEVALWDVCDYISPKLEKIYFSEKGFRFKAHGVESVQLYMLKPEEFNTKKEIKVRYNGSLIKTEPFETTIDGANGTQSYCYCETAQLKSENNAKLENQTFITYADQKVENVYAAYEGLKYSIECICKARTEEDGDVDGRTIYIGEIFLRPYLRGLVQDSRLKGEVYLSDKSSIAGRSNGKSYSLTATGDNDGSYTTRIPISDSCDEIDITVSFYVEDAGQEKYAWQTICAKLILNGKRSSEHNYCEDGIIHITEKTIYVGNSIGIDLDDIFSGIQLRNINCEGSSSLKFDIDEENKKIVIKSTESEENTNYKITGKDEAGNLFTVEGKIKVKQRNIWNLTGSILLPVVLILLLVLSALYIDLTSYLEIKITDDGELLTYLVRKIDNNKDNLYEMLEPQVAVENLKDIKVSKKKTGKFIVLDRKTGKKTVLSKKKDLYKATSSISLARVKR